MAIASIMSEAAAWISSQLSMPDGDDVRIFTQAEIHAEIAQSAEHGEIPIDEADWLRECLVGYKERNRMLAWSEVQHEEENCTLELHEAIQSTTTLSEGAGRIAMPGGYVKSIFPACQFMRIHRLIVIRANDITGEAEVLEEITVSQLLDTPADSHEGYSEDDLQLAVESWVKLGGDLCEISNGPPSYLLELQGPQ
jgi:hypothetical protein